MYPATSNSVFVFYSFSLKRSYCYNSIVLRVGQDLDLRDLEALMVVVANEKGKHSFAK